MDPTETDALLSNHEGISSGDEHPHHINDSPKLKSSQGTLSSIIILQTLYIILLLLEAATTIVAVFTSDSYPTLQQYLSFSAYFLLLLITVTSLFVSNFPLKSRTLFFTILTLCQIHETRLLFLSIEADTTETERGLPNPKTHFFVMWCSFFFSRALVSFILTTSSFLANTFPPLSEKDSTKKPQQNIFQYFGRFKRVWPLLWSEEFNWNLKCMLMGCFITLTLGRVVNVLLPLQQKKVVDAILAQVSNDYWLKYFGSSNNTLDSCLSIQSPDSDISKLTGPIKELMIFFILTCLQGGMGIIAGIQNYIWVPLGQAITKSVTLSMFEHLHNLSLRFHLMRKTGEILRVQGKTILINVLH